MSELCKWGVRKGVTRVDQGSTIILFEDVFMDWFLFLLL